MKDNDILDGKDVFHVFTPGCLEVDLTKGGEDIEKTRPIGGTCSTEKLDRQDESVFAKGLDFSEFVNHGFFNDNHKQETAAVLGEPNMAELRDNKWFTAGNLYLDYPPADRVWMLAKAMKKSNSSRRLGFSIEGKVQQRSFDGRILKAKIRHVAITNSPVNTDCSWDILAKAFAPLAQIEDMNDLKRAVTVGASSPDVSGMRTVRGEKRLRKVGSIDEAVQLIKSARPGYSWATCERVARVLFKTEV